MQHTLIAVFDNRADAQSAMTELLGAGFDRARVRLSEDAGGLSNSTAMGGAGSGAADEGIGARIKHFFGDLFGDADSPHTQKYSAAIERGHHALTVTATDETEVERAADIVERFGPVDIDEKAAEWGTATGATAYGAGSMSPAQGSQAGQSMQRQAPAPVSETYAAGNIQRDSLTGSQQRDTGARSIPVVEEQLKVGKREVQRGGVRVYSHIVETPVHENVSLREEHVNVQRRPVGKALDPDNAAAFKEQTIELRETGEEAVVQKTARVVEEVVVSKDVSQRQQSIDDTVRHTEVEVEQLGKQGVRDDSVYRSHFASNYGTGGERYEDYAPAYSYGYDMANKYTGRQWDDVQGDLRTDWESRGSGGAANWEKFKAAIRHGWDSMTK